MQGSNGKKRPRSAVEAALPSNEEQKQLQNIDILMRSNLYQLQTNELLEQVDGSKKMNKKKFLDWVDQVQEVIGDKASKHSMHDREVSSSWLQRQNFCGLRLANAGKEYTLTYKCPETIVVGSHAIGAVVSPQCIVDIAVVMPNDIFDQRDILNHIYFDKRRLYLAALWKTLQLRNKKDALFGTIELRFLMGDDRKPVLQVSPAFSSEYAMRIYPVVSADTFKAVQLRLGKNNVRPPGWRPSGEDHGQNLPGTPDYNRAILEDMAVQLQAKLLSRVFSASSSSSSSLRQTLVLLKVWLTQREQRFSAQGLGSHPAALLLAGLTLLHKLSPAMAPFAAFSALLSFLAETDFSRWAIDLTASKLVPRGAVHGDSALVVCHPLQPSSDASPDLAVLHNCTWRLSRSALACLQAEARQSISAVQQQVDGAFDAVFMQHRGLLDRAGLVFRVPVLPWPRLLHCLRRHAAAAPPDTPDGRLRAHLLAEAERGQLHTTPAAFLAAQLDALLPCMLGDRMVGMEVVPQHRTAAALLGVARPEESCVPAWEDPAGEKEEEGDAATHAVLAVGVALSPEHCSRRVEKGPAVAAPGDVRTSPGAAAADARGLDLSAAALQTDSEAFAAFYGPERCSVRRFRSGEIVHAVVWESQGAAGQVVDEVLAHLLPRHLPAVFADGGGEGGEAVAVAHRQVDEAVDRLGGGGEGEAEARLALQAALDELKAALVHKLTGLPLRYDSLHIAHPAARYTSLAPPRPHPVLALSRVDAEGRLVDGAPEDVKAALKAHMGALLSLRVSPAVTVLAVFEHSNKWPDTAAAIDHCKQAFLLQTKKALYEQFQIASFVHAEDPGVLHVVHKGFLFRVSPFAQLDVERLRLHQVARAAEAAADDSAGPDEHAALRLYVCPGLHHNSVKALAATHPVYARTVRAFQLWRDQHYFSNHLCDAAVELLVARDFVPGASRPPATSSLCGLHRALSRLVHTPFEDEPVVVDFSGELTAADQAAVLLRFRALRAAHHKAWQQVQACGEADGAAEAAAALLSRDVSPSMYLVSSADRGAGLEMSPALCVPERVVLRLMVAAATRSLQRLQAFVAQPAQAADALDLALGNAAVLKKCDHVLAFHEALGASPAAAGSVQVYANLPLKEVAVDRLIVRPRSLATAQDEVLNRLEQKFARQAVFFHNRLQGDALGVLLRPSFSQPVPFSILRTAHRKCSEDDQQQPLLRADVDALLQSMLREADGLLLRSSAERRQ